MSLGVSLDTALGPVDVSQCLYARRHTLPLNAVELQDGAMTAPRGCLL